MDVTLSVHTVHVFTRCMVNPTISLYPTPYNTIHMSPIEDVIEDIESLKPGEHPDYKKIANKHGGEYRILLCCGRTRLLQHSL